jgi:micrococcal nuclease
MAVVGWLAVMTGCTAPGADSARQSPEIVVVQVIDGDTVNLAFGDVTERVRLLGIDAPESVHPTLPEQCFGRESSEVLGRLLPPGAEVHVFRDKQLRDHFGRLLLYVQRADDGLPVNRFLVENGLAAASFYEPNTQLRSEIAGAERRAREAGVGLWGSCDGPDQPLE